MTVQQPMMAHHTFPWWLELVGAAIIGAALLFGALLVVGDNDALPWNDSSPSTSSWVLEEQIPPQAR